MPFFQGATDFEINGGSFYEVKGNQHNSNYDQSLKVSGEGNAVSLSPDYSRRDNRTLNMNYSNTDMQTFAPGSGQHYAGGAHPQQWAPPPISYEQYQMYLFSQAYANLQLRDNSTDTRQQRLSNSDLPQIANHPHDNSGDLNTILGNLSPRQQQNLPNNPQYSSQLPQPPLQYPYPPPPGWVPPSNPQLYPHPPPQAPGRSQGPGLFSPFDGFNAPSGVLSGQDPALPALMNLQERFLQRAQSQNGQSSPRPSPEPQSPSKAGGPSTFNQSQAPATQRVPSQSAPHPPHPVQPPTASVPNPQTRPLPADRPHTGSNEEEDLGQNEPTYEGNVEVHPSFPATTPLAPVGPTAVPTPNTIPPSMNQSPPPAPPQVQSYGSNIATSPFLHENTSPSGAPIPMATSPASAQAPPASAPPARMPSPPQSPTSPPVEMPGPPQSSVSLPTNIPNPQSSTPAPQFSQFPGLQRLNQASSSQGPTPNVPVPVAPSSSKKKRPFLARIGFGKKPGRNQ